MPTITPDLFRDEAIAPETKALNRAIVETLDAAPDQWTLPVAEVRRRRTEGRGAWPVPVKSERAKAVVIEGPGGPVRLRVIAPERPRGVYLHLHGGGWIFGAADEQDMHLERLAQGAGLACVSVDYRLAPEHPYPAAPDDCEAAALFVVENAQRLFGTTRLTIGGESAGAHLAVVTLLRLRDRKRLTPFRGANLVAGCYDLTLTPSARAFGEERLILRTSDVRQFVTHFAGGEADLTHPDLSPLYADLAGMPPALFSVGTRDALLDDTLFMAARWTAAGNRTELAVHPGGAHVFQRFDFPLAEDSVAQMERFLAERV
jgi:acetyl esterase